MYLLWGVQYGYSVRVSCVYRGTGMVEWINSRKRSRVHDVLQRITSTVHIIDHRSASRC